MLSSELFVEQIKPIVYSHFIHVYFIYDLYESQIGTDSVPQKKVKLTVKIDLILRVIGMAELSLVFVTIASII